LSRNWWSSKSDNALFQSFTENPVKLNSYGIFFLEIFLHKTFGNNNKSP